MNRLREFREKAGLSQTRLGELVGTSQATINRIERSKAKLTKEWAMKLAPALNTTARELMFSDSTEGGLTGVSILTVEGVSEAGMFRDISLMQHDDEEDRPTITVARDPRFGHAHQYALLVSGDSMNKLFASGSYVVCVDFADSGLPLKAGMILHVERRQGALVETTIKQFAVRKGSRWLDPCSTNPAHKPIALDHQDDTEVVVRGVVTGSYTRFDMPR